MRDYLKIAADRAQGRAAPAIQPRIPSLFEPPAVPLSARFTRFAATPGRPELQPSMTNERPVEPAQTPRPQVQQSLPASMRQTREILTPPELGQRAHVDHRESKDQPTLPEMRPKTDPMQPTIGSFEHHAEVVTPVVNTPPARIVVQPKTTQEPELRAPVRVEHASSKSPALAPRPEFKQEIHSRTVERQVERSVVKEVIDRVKRVQSEPPPARQQNAAVGSVRTVAAPHEPKFSTSEPLEDTRPVINVVIGRVSVNAVTERPTVAAKMPKSAGPGLSLDQYLEQRRRQS